MSEFGLITQNKNIECDVSQEWNLLYEWKLDI